MSETQQPNSQSSVRQGFVISSFLFTLAIDCRATKNMINQQRTGIRWNLCSSLEDQICADDLALSSHTRDQVQRKTSNLEQQASSIDSSTSTSSFIWAASSVSKEVQKKTSKHNWEKPGQHLQIYSCYGDPQYTPKRPNSRSTRAMSSLCSSMAQSAGA